MAYEYIDEKPKGRYEFIDEQPTAAPVSRTEKLLRGIKDPLDGAAQLFEKVKIGRAHV